MHSSTQMITFSMNETKNHKRIIIMETKTTDLTQPQSPAERSYTVKSEAKWKTQFQIMWNNTPKKLRRTISQVNNIKSQAKLYVALWT